MFNEQRSQSFLILNSIGRKFESSFVYVKKIKEQKVHEEIEIAVSINIKHSFIFEKESKRKKRVTSFRKMRKVVVPRRSKAASKR